MGSTDTEINWTEEHRHQPTSSEHTLAQRREHPYLCATWLPRLLTGENSCEWAGWFKAHHQDWTRTSSEFNQAEWMLNHTALLNKRKANWNHGGFDVNIEGQNSFQLQGRSATLAGKPDLITQRDGQAVIVDVKTGQGSVSHVVQVMIYLYAIPRVLERYRTLKLRGQATYQDHTVRIPAEAVDDQFIQNLGAWIRRLAADKAPRPSAEQTGMSLLRHQRPRLPGARGRRLRARRRNYQRLLIPPLGVVASSSNW